MMVYSYELMRNGSCSFEYEVVRYDEIDGVELRIVREDKWEL